MADTLDLTSPLHGFLTITGASQEIKSIRNTNFNLSLYGTWVGSMQLQRSFNRGVTWLDVGSPYTANVETTFFEPEGGVNYRFNFTRTSGTINFRLGQ